MAQTYLKDETINAALTRLPANDRQAKERQIMDESRNILLVIDGDEYEQMTDAQAEKFIEEKRTEIAKKVLGLAS